MIVECCSQERSYSNFYGLIGERFSKLNPDLVCDKFQEAFGVYFDTIHRYETNKLRNIGRFFGHLIASDAISWAVMAAIHMNEEDTTSSSRIFVKILMQEMTEEMGLDKLVERFKLVDTRAFFVGMFPMDNPKNTRFAINYFTSIGLGRITEEMRAWLQNAPKMLAAQHAALKAQQSSDEDSDESSVLSSSSDSSSDDSDDSVDSRRSPRKNRSSPPRRNRRYSSASRSPTPPRRSTTNGQSRPSVRRDSPSPRPNRNGGRRHSVSRSPPPPPRRRDASPSPARRSSIPARA